MKNKLVADILYQIADLLDIKGEIFFKTRAYRMAAQTIEVLDEDIDNVVKEGRLESIQGVGEALAKKIKEIVETGNLEYFERLKKEIPEGLLELLELPGLGPKKVAALYKNLDITTVDALRKACLQGKLRDLDGFGEITERNILRGIQLREKTSGRVLLNVAYQDGNKYLDYIKKCPEVEDSALAGSFRRKKETIGDLDILISSKKPEEVMTYFVKYTDVSRVLMKGPTKSSVLLSDGLQVDLRVVKKESYGAALQYFTGSKEHNVKMRSIAIKKGYRLNEYGLFEKDTHKFVTGRLEKDVYSALGLDYIEPELRENMGEIEAASKGKLPNLVEEKDIKGDLHIHSIYSDGTDSIDTIATHAQKLGYEYVGIADHSQSLKVARGLSEENLIKKQKEIQQINKKLKKTTVLFGTECDIKTDGTLDYPDDILAKFDFVIVGVHTALKMDPKQMEKRILSGIENKHADILAHPTGRLIGRREPFKIDIENIIDTAKKTNTFLEINSFPDRLDLNSIHAKLAKEKEVKCVIGTDAHNVANMSYIEFGLATARRGWQEKSDILNTYCLKDLIKMLGR
jgi:DNA polymerase (family 10)